MQINVTRWVGQTRVPASTSVFRRCRLGLFVVLLGMGPALLAQPNPQDFDIRGVRPHTLPVPGFPLLPEQSRALEALRGEAPGDLVTRWSALTGAPSRISRRGGALTLPTNVPARAVANAFLGRYRGLFNLSPQDVQEMRFSRDFRTQKNGVSHLTLQQRANGIGVFGGEIKVNIDPQGRILNVSGEPIPNIHAVVNASVPLVTQQDASTQAAMAIGVDNPENASAAGLVYFPQTPEAVRLAWRVGFENAASADAYDAIVDAMDGKVLWWQNRTQHDHFSTHGEVYTSDSPIPNTPKGTSVGEVARDDVPFHAGDFFPHDDTHYDWWAAGARTTTTSNNVDAYADRDGDNSPDAGSRPTASGDDFTFPLDLSTDQPDAYNDAAVTNLFYWNNRMHDFFYVLGFDEGAGNFQSNNFGLGGSGGDAVMAEAQDNADGASRCNANMSTPFADGNAPRMQMYICDDGSPARDGDLDNVVIAHEYTHGVHTRLVATSSNQAANEGWCDFFGLSVVAEPGDAYGGSYGIADYLFFGNGDGIRTDPYSTDQGIFQLTYEDLNGAASCAVRVCSNDDTQACTEDDDCGGATDTCDAQACMFHEDCQPPNTTINQGLCRTSVYRTGEIWANALWIARMNIVAKYGYAAGHRTMNELVVDGMKLSPNDPTLLDGRDAILTADLANNNGANECLIWDAFAKMGMGRSAATTGVDDINPLEGYDVPTYCAPVMQVNAPAEFGGVCESGSAEKQLEVYNTGQGDLIVTSVAVASGSSDISVDPLPEAPVFISADAHVDFTVRCTPTSPGVKTATVRIETNDTANPTYDIEYTCNGGQPDMVLFMANSGNFGDTCPGGFTDLGLTIQNNGTCPLEVTGISSSDAEFLVADGSTSLSVEAGNSVVVPIRYQPDAFGSDPAETVTVTGNDGSDSVDVSGNAPPPDIQAAIANAGDFGDVCKTDQADLDLTLFNQGKCDLTIDGISLTGAGAGSFELPSDLTLPLVLSPDADFRLPVRYAPEACNDAGESATVVITSDDPDENPVNIAINGTSPCPNLVIDPVDVTGLYAFPATVVDATGSLGCFSERSVVLRNSGACPLTIDGISASEADFAVTEPTQFPVVLPTGEETLEVTVRFTPQEDADPLAPDEVTGLLSVASDDPDAMHEAELCGESVAQSGVRLLVTDISSGAPLPVDGVDEIILSSKGKSKPGPINLRFTDQPLSSSVVCGNTITYHVDQETLPALGTTGSNPKSSYTTKAKEGNLQVSESFGLAQCEFREFQLQLQDADAEVCLLKAKGESCVTDGECCSGKCQGKPGAKLCK